MGYVFLFLDTGSALSLGTPGKSRHHLPFPATACRIQHKPTSPEHRSSIFKPGWAKSAITQTQTCFPSHSCHSCAAWTSLSMFGLWRKLVLLEVLGHSRSKKWTNNHYVANHELLHFIEMFLGCFFSLLCQAARAWELGQSPHYPNKLLTFHGSPIWLKRYWRCVCVCGSTAENAISEFKVVKKNGCSIIQQWNENNVKKIRQAFFIGQYS